MSSCKIHDENGKMIVENSPSQLIECDKQSTSSVPEETRSNIELSPHIPSDSHDIQHAQKVIKSIDLKTFLWTLNYIFYRH